MSEKLENRTKVLVNKNCGVFDAVVKLDRLECSFTADTLRELSAKVGISVYLMEKDIETERMSQEKLKESQR